MVDKMINKQNLWFITLFSLIIVLSIYYVSLPEKSIVSMVSNTSDLSEVIEINEADVLIALKVEEEEKLLSEMESAQHQLLDNASSIDQKNIAYQSLQSISSKRMQMQKIEKLLKEKYSLESYIKINGNNINIVISGKDQGIEFVNKLIQEVQKLYEETKYITVKFQK